MESKFSPKIKEIFWEKALLSFLPKNKCLFDVHINKFCIH